MNCLGDYTLRGTSISQDPDGDDSLTILNSGLGITPVCISP